MVFSVLSIGAGPCLIDYVAKALRPVSVCTRIVRAAFQVIDAIYPNLVAEPGAPPGLDANIQRCKPGGSSRLHK